MGYYIAEPFWGKGLGTSAVKQTCTYIFEHTDIIRIFAEPFAYNTASCRILEKGGFTCEGTLRKNAVKNGQIIDMEMYSNIFPKHGMEVREGQIALCHNMLDAFADKRISLCHAGVGIGKTSAYIVAAVVWDKYRPCDASTPFSPFIIATSSIALQNAILEDYIPQLSDILCSEGIMDEPFSGILRKGKGNYVCPLRLARRIESINPDRRNKQKLDALLALRLNMDISKAPRLSKYDKERVAIPDSCPRKCEDANDCVFLRMLEAQQNSTALFQVCNHNYFLADSLNRMRGYSPLLPAYRGLVVWR